MQEENILMRSFDMVVSRIFDDAPLKLRKQDLFRYSFRLRPPVLKLLAYEYTRSLQVHTDG